MDDKHIRMANLAALLHKTYGNNQSAMATAARERSTKERKPSFFNDLLAGRKSFGGALARRLEVELSLERLSLDQDPERGPPKTVKQEIDWPFSIAKTRFDDLGIEQRRAIGLSVIAMIEAFESLKPQSIQKKRPSGKRRSGGSGN